VSLFSGRMEAPQSNDVPAMRKRRQLSQRTVCRAGEGQGEAVVVLAERNRMQGNAAPRFSAWPQTSKSAAATCDK